jgi:UDPglucose 6-dehydrogenase/GDP-mannose 6-dehydrogenase
MKVAVVGCGYVGLVSAVGLASVGHQVVGVEDDAGRREHVAAGVPPFHEPGLAERLRAVRAHGALEVSDDVAAVRDSDVVLLAVQTPPDRDGAIDLGPLTAAAEAVGRCLAEDDRRRVVATRSTVLPGTAERTVQPLLDCAAPAATTAAAANPEFLREGCAVADFLQPDRVVVGCHADWGAQLLSELYHPLGAPVTVTTPATAELAKYTSNAFLATLISFSNEIARISEDLPGVDVEEVLEVLHSDRRLRPPSDDGEPGPAILSYLRAGCGYGGSCLPKDVAALTAARRRAGEAAPLLEAVRAVNDAQPERFVELASDALDGLDGRRCAVLGLTFKAGTDDLRDSPGLAAVAALRRRGASVVAFDPLVGKEALAAAGAPAVELAATMEEALAGADACLVTTADPAFARLPELVSARTEPPVVIDGRRVLAPERFPAAAYAAIGRGGPQAARRPSEPPTHRAAPRPSRG